MPWKVEEGELEEECEFQSCFLPQFCYSPTFAEKRKGLDLWSSGNVFRSSGLINGHQIHAQPSSTALSKAGCDVQQME